MTQTVRFILQFFCGAIALVGFAALSGYVLLNANGQTPLPKAITLMLNSLTALVSGVIAAGAGIKIHEERSAKNPSAEGMPSPPRSFAQSVGSVAWGFVASDGIREALSLFYVLVYLAIGCWALIAFAIQSLGPGGASAAVENLASIFLGFIVAAATAFFGVTLQKGTK